MPWLTGEDSCGDRVRKTELRMAMDSEFVIVLNLNQCVRRCVQFPAGNYSPIFFRFFDGFDVNV